MRQKEIKETIRAAMSEMGKLRAKKLSKERRKEISSKGGASAWKGLSKAQRSKIMKARAKKRRERQRKGED